MAGSSTANDNGPSAQVQASNLNGRRGKRKGTAFWLVFFALCVTTFLAALELVRPLFTVLPFSYKPSFQTSVSTALPTISHDLSLDTSFVWVGNAYSLASTACFPLSGALAQVWGRKSIMLGSIVLFAVGSALAGAAKNAAMIISGRSMCFRSQRMCMYRSESACCCL
jgi:MFS family permease